MFASTVLVATGAELVKATFKVSLPKLWTFSARFSTNELNLFPVAMMVYIALFVACLNPLSMSHCSDTSGRLSGIKSPNFTDSEFNSKSFN